jgi:prophage antirepressor-like protein
MSDERITPFLFEGESIVRTILRHGAPWFVSADACRAIGIANASQAVDALDDDEKGICSIDTPGGAQEMLIISESGLFTLILRCRDAVKKGTLPHRFRRWVTGVVLPELRGRDGQIAIQFAPAIQQPEQVKVRLVTEARQTFGCQAAADLWFRLDLPTVPAMRMAFSAPQRDFFFAWRSEESSIPPCS